MDKYVKFIDLFCGIGGLRLGFEQACQELNVKPKCVFSSEIKKTAIEIYQQNFNGDTIEGDITKIESDKIPDFDILLAGFPCQSFSSAGTRQGLGDKRGILFYDIERILKTKNPTGFILENVPNLLKHENGKTWKIIKEALSNLGYYITYKVLNSKDFGLPQNRERIYIIGTRSKSVNLEDFPVQYLTLKTILQEGQETLNTKFIQKLLSLYSVSELYGKSIKDKRGGDNNIHSWELQLKGTISKEQKELLNFLLKERRKKIWAEKKGIKWMDGMPLTLQEIASTYQSGFFLDKMKILKEILDDLVKKSYLKYEHPKDEYEIINELGKKIKKRIPRKDVPKGYNIVTGKLSFEINKILDPNDIAPTMVATDMERIGVIDKNEIRRLTIREGLRLFGFPESFNLDIPPKLAFDLLGNTVPVPVIQAVSIRLLTTLYGSNSEFSDLSLLEISDKSFQCFLKFSIPLNLESLSC